MSKQPPRGAVAFDHQHSVLSRQYGWTEDPNTWGGAPASGLLDVAEAAGQFVVDLLRIFPMTEERAEHMRECDCVQCVLIRRVWALLPDLFDEEGNSR